MKRLVFLCLFCALLLCSFVPALAANEAQRVEHTATVGQDGGCQISITITLQLESAITDLNFPLPAEATEISLNGNFVTTQASGQRLLVQLPNLSAGSYTFTLRYCLPEAVSRESDHALVTVPLLSGFPLPIRELTFSVTLPGEITGQPNFRSGYYQEHIAASVQHSVSGSTLTGQVTVPLKDHETLELTLPAESELFPLVEDLTPWIDPVDGIIAVLLLLAIGYYLLTLMPQLTPRSRCFTPPEGISPGEVGTCLTGTGADLTMMVFSWAQMGYLQLELRSKRQVILHKRMEMGNERSRLEMQAFQTLFGNRRMVDGGGVHYARLYRKLALQSPLMRQLFTRRSGKPLLFRLLCCTAGVVSGARLGNCLSLHSVWSVLLAILLALLCGGLSYIIQSGGKCLPLRNKMPMYLALLCGAGWLGLGVLADRPLQTLFMVVTQLLCGIAIAYGGRRSELGKRSLSQIRGLRHYMVRANTFELQQRLQQNHNFYYELAPYALVLGVDKRFARRFGKTALPDSGCLLGIQPPETAREWAALLRHMAQILNRRQSRLLLEQLTGKH